MKEQEKNWEKKYWELHARSGLDRIKLEKKIEWLEEYVKRLKLLVPPQDH